MRYHSQPYSAFSAAYNWLFDRVRTSIKINRQFEPVIYLLKISDVDHAISDCGFVRLLGHRDDVVQHGAVHQLAASFPNVDFAVYVRRDRDRSAQYLFETVVFHLISKTHEMLIFSSIDAAGHLYRSQITPEMMFPIRLGDSKN